MDHFELERDEPGVLVSFQLPSVKAQAMLQDNQVIEINYKELFKKLTGRKRNASVTEANSSSNANNGNKLLPKSGSSLDAFDLRPSNRFESIIDKLERKYYALSNYQNLSDNEDMSSHSSKSSSPSSFTASPYHNNNTKTTSTAAAKRKKKVHNQDYDYEDPFIDDSEAVGEIEEVLHMKRMKTVHEGYFVSSGQLDVIKAPKVSKSAVAKPSAPEDTATSKTGTSSGSNLDAASNKSKSVPKTGVEKEKAKDKKSSEDHKEKAPKDPSEKDKEKNKDKAPKEKSKDKEKVKEAKEQKQKESTIEKETEPISSLATDLNAVIEESQSSSVLEDGKAMEQDGDGEKEEGNKKVKVEKPLWEPSPEAVLALQIFRKFVLDSGIIVSKKSNFPKEWELALSELETVILSHHSVKDISRTRGYYESIQEIVGPQFTVGKIKSIILRTNAREKAKMLKFKIDEQVHTLREELKTIIVECPDNKQPGSRPRKTKSSEEKGEDDDENNQGDDMLLIDVVLPEAAAVVSSVPMEVDNSQTATSTTNQTEAASNQPQIRYKWYCKWSIPTRQALIDIEDCCEEWVNAENKYREKLSIAEKREIGEEQVRQPTILLIML